MSPLLPHWLTNRSGCWAHSGTAYKSLLIEAWGSHEQVGKGSKSVAGAGKGTKTCWGTDSQQGALSPFLEACDQASQRKWEQRAEERPSQWGKLWDISFAANQRSCSLVLGEQFTQASSTCCSKPCEHLKRCVRHWVGEMLGTASQLPSRGWLEAAEEALEALKGHCWEGFGVLSTISRVNPLFCCSGGLVPASLCLWTGVQNWVTHVCPEPSF